MARPAARKSRPKSKPKPVRAAARALQSKVARSSASRSKPGRRKTGASKSGKPKWVYAFGGGKADGRADMRNLLGGKGAGLAEMANLGLPVPPGFTITTDVCTYYYANANSYPPELERQVNAALTQVARITGKTF